MRFGSEQHSTADSSDNNLEEDMKHYDYKASGLFFRIDVQTLGIADGKKTRCERKYKEFEYLRAALARSFPGCFVPKMNSTDLGSVA